MQKTAEEIKNSLNVTESRGFYLEELTSDLLHEAGCMPIVMPLPDDYQKRFQYLGNMLAQMSYSHKIKDDRLRQLLRTISTTYSYLLNSYSFENGKLEDFDAQEISRRLEPWKE